MHISLIQRYLILSTFFCLALLPLLYFSTSTYLEKNHFLDLEIQGNQHQNILKNLIDILPRHQNLAHRYLKGQKNVTGDLDRLDHMISDSFEQLVNSATNTPPSSSSSLTPNETYQKWKQLNSQSNSVQASDQLHLQMIEEIQNLFHFLGNQYNLFGQTDSYSNNLILSAFIEIPHLQALIYQATYTIGESLFDLEFTLQTKQELIAILALLKSRLHSLQQDIHQALQQIQNIRSVFNQDLTASLSGYEKSIQQLVQILNQTLLLDKEPSLTREDLMTVGNTVIVSGLNLWNLINDEIDYLLTKQQETLRNRFWLAVLLSAGITLAAFIFGLLFCFQALRRLKSITQAVENMADGRPNTRISFSDQDEISHLALSFNHLGQRFEEVIYQFHELIKGIQKLADGDFSVRLGTHPEKQEFNKVAYIFNQTAQTYEEIMSRLQQLGFTLTNSANRIAAGSKEQETIIIEQESTTREIAVAANEISATAKEFANTLKDISHVAEQISHLAITGKDSLNNMKFIMQKMVNASSSISTRLTVLNEKAANITSVITTITKVADQTNLLSLNASIEAEKAGEYGKSFAVIAREIRRLADQTALSTLDIEKIVNEIMTAISSNVLGVEDFTLEIRQGMDQIGQVSSQLATIMEQVQHFIARFAAVNEGMQAQSTGAEQINEALGQLSHTAQQTTQSIHQFHHTIEELNTAANQLRVLIPRINTSIQKNNERNRPF